MSDGRKRLCGAEYKKKAKLKKEEQKQIIHKTIKIDSFFKSGSGSSVERPGTSTTCIDTIQSGKDETDLNSAAQQQQSSVEQSTFEKTDIYVFDEEAVEESSISIKIEDTSQNQTLSNDQVQTSETTVKSVTLVEESSEQTNIHQHDHRTSGSLGAIVQDVWQQTAPLFKPPHHLYTAICYIMMMCFFSAVGAMLLSSNRSRHRILHSNFLGNLVGILYKLGSNFLCIIAVSCYHSKDPFDVLTDSLNNLMMSLIVEMVLRIPRTLFKLFIQDSSLSNASHNLSWFSSSSSNYSPWRTQFLINWLGSHLQGL
uniref:Uncharacterized protein n=1 Tax=Timema genevievae TaxID=629358 RepID=A0A7R9K6K6_TIMGE|nr:unnamed protein product [Timema genevievae]